MPVYWLKGQERISLKNVDTVSNNNTVNERNILSKLGVFVAMVIVLESPSDDEIPLLCLWITSVHGYDDFWSE